MQLTHVSRTDPERIGDVVPQLAKFCFTLAHGSRCLLARSDVSRHDNETRFPPCFDRFSGYGQFEPPNASDGRQFNLFAARYTDLICLFQR